MKKKKVIFGFITLLTLGVLFFNVNDVMASDEEVVESDVNETTTVENVELEQQDDIVDQEVLDETQDDSSNTNEDTKSTDVDEEELITEIENSDEQVLEENSSSPIDNSVSENKQDAGLNESETQSIDVGFVRTNGGADDIDVMYESVEDAAQNTNPISISGAAMDGIYLDEIEYDGIEYVEFSMGGGIFYMPKVSLSLIAKEDALASSHYENVNGEWVFFEAVDILESTEYNQYSLGEAPSWSSEGVYYYTADQETYYTSIEELQNATINNVQTRGSVLSGSSYFQNLPLKSASNYEASDYKSYLNSIGKSNSQYYNDTDAFVDAQTEFSINSLMLFAFANHESAYGYSTYSVECNNFFGRGAYDSNPDNACISYGYDTPYDGIMSQALFVSYGYYDVLDWKFNGTHVGNKASGMNVYYASDPNWGTKIASLAYNADQAMGGEDYGMYSIGLVDNGTTVYEDSSRSTKLKVITDGSTSEENYTLTQAAGTSSSDDYGVKVILRDEANGSYEIQLPTPINNSGTDTCYWINTNQGAYPNYSGKYANSVEQGTAHYACDYNDYSNQIGYVNKSDVTVLNDSGYITPEEIQNVIYKYYSNGAIKTKFVMDGKYIDYAIGYDTDGEIIAYYTYNDNTEVDETSGNVKEKFYVDADGYIDYSETRENGAIIEYRQYYSKTTFAEHDDNLKYIYYMNGDYIDYAVKSDGDLVETYYEYYNKTTYGDHAGNIKYKFYMDGKYVDYAEKQVDGKITTYYEYYSKTVYGDCGGNIKYKFYLENDEETIDYAEKQLDGEVTNYYVYNTNTKYPDYSGNMKYRFFINSSGYINYAEKHDNGVMTNYYEYYPNTKFGDHGDSIKYKFYLENDEETIDYAEKQLDGEVINYYVYSSNTKYPDYSGNMKYRFFIDSDGYITYAEKHEDEVITNYYEYYPNTEFGDHGNNIKYKFYLERDEETIDYAEKQLDGEVINYYIYNGNTKYPDYSGNMKYRFFIDGDGYITYAERFVNGKVDKNYIYNDKTKFGDHSENIKYEFYVDDNGEIDYARRKKNGEVDKYYLYNEGTTFENYSGNLLYDFKLNSDSTIDYSREFDDNIIIKIYQYYDGTTIDDYTDSVEATFYIDEEGYIEYAQTDDYYYYYEENTTFGDHGSHIVSKVPIV